MQIVMTLLVRDEQDVIRENIDFHLSQGVDFFIATDNRSVDTTAKILREYEKKGRLRYLYEGADDYQQCEWVTRMARMAFTEYGANWVINNDADEFWWPRSGTLRSTFANISHETNMVVADRANFVVTEDERGRFVHRMVYREAVSLNALGRPLPPKVAHRGCAAIDVAQGNHSVTGLDHPRSISGVIDILHFPIRSYRQLENKIVKGGAAYERNTRLPQSAGATWRQLYRQYKQDNGLHEYFMKHYYDTQRLHEQLETGVLVKDERLSSYFMQHGL